MKHCRTKGGVLRLRWEGKDYEIDGTGKKLPDALAEDIRGHVNVIVEGDDVVEEAAVTESPPESEPEPEPSGDDSEDDDDA